MSKAQPNIEKLGNLLADPTRPMKERFRALFSLRHIASNKAIDQMLRTLVNDKSDLLMHECAYLIGQTQNSYALPTLLKVLSDNSYAPIVRHEVGEAIGAICKEDSLEILEKYLNDPAQEVSQTCELAVERIKWVRSTGKVPEDGNPYASVDPAPAHEMTDIDELEKIMVDVNQSLFNRYKAMFQLRNIGGEKAVLALSRGLLCDDSALFRHEIAYVLGQMQHKASIPALINNLKNLKENGMVRHECVEALGSIAEPECVEFLKEYINDEEAVVRESCEVALDMAEYENSSEFDYML